MADRAQRARLRPPGRAPGAPPAPRVHERLDMAPHVHLQAYYKLEGTGLPTPPMLSPASTAKSPRNSIERKRGTFRLSALSSAIERSVWEDSPRSSIQSFTVARPNQRTGPPITWLPPELLCYVFELIADAQPPYSHHSLLSQTATLGWITIGHVCHHWRALLLAMPHLWGAAVGTLDRAKEAMLARAADAPVTLTLDDQYENGCDFHAAHVARARALRLTVSSALGCLYDMRTAMGAQPLPALDALEIVYAFGHIPPHNFDLPPLRAPALRRVRMENYFLPWAAPALAHLTLARTRPLSPGEARPALRELLDLLRANGALRVLSLCNWAPEAPPPPDNERVRLPLLERLELADRPPALAALWGALAVPPHTLVSLRADMLGTPDGGAAGVPNAVFRELGAHFRAPGAAPLTRVAVSDCRGDSFLRVRAAAAVDLPGAPRLSVELWPWRPASAVDFQHALAAFALHLPLRDVETLTLDCPAADRDGGDAQGLGWREPLAPMRRLRVLEIHDAPPPSLLRALGPEREAPGELLFPALRALVLRPCAHRRRDEARPLAWMRLYNALRIRARREAALRRLELYGYFRLEPPARTKVFQEQLDKVVVEIEWEL